MTTFSDQEMYLLRQIFKSWELLSQQIHEDINGGIISLEEIRIEHSEWFMGEIGKIEASEFAKKLGRDL